MKTIKLNRNKKRNNIVTDAIDSAFGVARRIVKNVTGFRKTKGKKKFIKGRPHGYPSLGTTASNPLTLRSIRNPVRSHYLEFVDSLLLTPDGTYEFGSNYMNNIALCNDLTASNQFINLKNEMVCYKPMGVRILCTSILNTPRVNEADEYTRGMVLPKAYFQIYSSRCPIIGSTIMLNKPTFILDPFKRNLDINLRFNDSRIVLPQDQGWRLPSEEPFNEHFPRLAVDADGIIEEFVSDKIPVVQITLQYWLLVTHADRSPNTDIKKIKLGNHKTRRIHKRINQRWDKIFSDPNCMTDSEPEAEDVKAPKTDTEWSDVKSNEA